MKKSEVYNLAQVAVILSPTITPEGKLEILRCLMSDEDLAKFVEDQEEKAGAEE